MNRHLKIVAYGLAVLMVMAVTSEASSRKLAQSLSPLLTDLTASSTGQTVIPDSNFVLLRDGNRVRVTVVGDFDAPHFPPEVEVLNARHGWATGWATAAGIAELLADPDVQAIYPPVRARPMTVATEGRTSMRWGPYNDLGVGGAGARVAIIDIGFAGYQTLLGSELPGSVYRQNFISPVYQGAAASVDHGTAVAEIVHDIAPEAQLFLLSIYETNDLIAAVQWCIDHNIGVVNMSLGFQVGPRDGSSVVAQEVDRAAAAGIIWANSAGNEAFGHWGGQWADANGNGYLDFGPSLDVIAVKWTSTGVGPLSVADNYLIWDRWPTTPDLSFDLEIYADAARTQLLVGSGSPSSLNLAYREANLSNPIAGNTYYLAVHHTLGTIPPNLRMDIFSDPATLSMIPRDSGYTLAIPGDARGAVTVGAYDYTKTTPGTAPIRYYSSEGPTWDGRLKPDIVAPDGVSTVTYGVRNFAGTSAASPHIAGAAALLASASVSGGLFTYVWSVDDFVRLMQARSIDFGAAGPDDIYGVGGAVLPPTSTSPDSFTVARAYPNPSNAGVNIAFAARPGLSFAVRVYDVLGRLVWQTERMHVGSGDARVHWAGKDLDGHEVGSGVYFYRIDTDYQTLTGKAVLLK